MTLRTPRLNTPEILNYRRQPEILLHFHHGTKCPIRKDIGRRPFTALPNPSRKASLIYELTRKKDFARASIKHAQASQLPPPTKNPLVSLRRGEICKLQGYR